MTKVLALYLPQFHAIPENDEWWGDGFTEWNVVKKAKKICKYINQPKVPLMGYYNLSNVEDIKRQVHLANKYRIDGFVIYSYYSKGKTLLETPANLILSHKELNIDYCFSWANHDWMRTWFSYNREMLRKQEYADNEEEIKEHFNYLLPFFQDKRYIKENNKPVMFIYDFEAIPNFEIYKKVWSEQAQMHGFDGIYFVQTLGGYNLNWIQNLMDACFDFEPTYTTFKNMKLQHSINRIKRALKRIIKVNRVTNYFDYRAVCSKMEKREENDKNHFLGVFAEWDNTPRHSHNGTVFKHFSIERFKECFSKQYAKSIRFNKPYLIIDAWNEWGEGAMMEPDSVYQYRKLETIKEIRDDVDKGKLVQ